MFLFLAAFNISFAHVNTGWLGLALWCLTTLLPAVAFNFATLLVITIILLLIILVLLSRTRRVGIP